MKNKGFTLIEMMVAVAIFAIVMTIGSTSLFTVLDANTKSQSIKVVLNNLNLALESMARNIRIGSVYNCGGTNGVANDCPSGSSTFAYEPFGGNTSDDADQVVYRLVNNQIERSVNGGLTYTGITAPEVIVEEMSFYVVGAPNTDNRQPKVLMVVRGYAGTREDIRTDFNLQTTISQRFLDVSI